jgi:hypothetical protein
MQIVLLMVFFGFILASLCDIIALFIHGDRCAVTREVQDDIT